MPDLGQFLAIIRTLFWHVQPVEHWREKNSMGNIEQKPVMCPERDKRHTWFNKHQHPIVQNLSDTQADSLEQIGLYSLES